MASRKKLAFAIQNVLTSIDLDAPVAKDEPQLTLKDSQEKTADAEQVQRQPQHIRDIIGDLSLDLD